MRLTVAGAALASMLVTILVTLAAIGAFVVARNTVIRVRHHECPIVVFEDQSWTPTNWSVADGFPPPGCRIVIARLGRPE